MNKELAEQLVKTRKSVRQKYQSLKSDVAQSQFQLEKGYKPITEPLEKLLSNIKADVSKIKQEPAEIKAETPTFTPRRSSVNVYSKYLPMNIPSFLEDTFQYDPADSDPVPEVRNSNDLIDEEVEKSRMFLQNISSTPAYLDYLEAYDPLPRQYIDISITGDEKENDRQYGVVHDMITEKFKIGGSELEIVGNDVKVNNIKYTGTPGLYELLFKKEPKGYNTKDLDNYMDILNRSSAYRRYYNPNEQVQGSQPEKYRNIIRPYLINKGILKPDASTNLRTFPKPPPPATRQLRKTQSLKNYTEGGLLDLSNRKVDYVYYDNPNELIERLRLLIASHNAGNNGHNNEIVSIIEELREAGIIK